MGSHQSVNIKPDISVIMSVYNGEQTLAITIDSVLSQENVQFEFIIVDDGSVDRTSEILDDYARRDARVRIIHQKNTGLTQALIRACSLANGKFIARQDAGDVSLAGRLAWQLEVFGEHPGVVMTSCGTRVIGPGDEVLYEICQVEEQLQRGLQESDINLIAVPPSTSVMFKRDAYEKVGGYRSQFFVAQDLDLYMRLSEIGTCWASPLVLCEVKLDKNSISANRREQQIRSAKVIVECAVARRSGGDEAALLTRWSERSSRNLRRSWFLPRKLHEARFYYFVGSQLRDREPKQAQLYFWRAVTRWCPYPRAWYSLIWYSLMRISGHK
jgi:glycosyltransferase involved in cell wall biosynthesis